MATVANSELKFRLQLDDNKQKLVNRYIQNLCHK